MRGGWRGAHVQRQLVGIAFMVYRSLGVEEVIALTGVNLVVQIIWDYGVGIESGGDFVRELILEKT